MDRFFILKNPEVEICYAPNVKKEEFIPGMKVKIGEFEKYFNEKDDITYSTYPYIGFIEKIIDNTYALLYVPEKMASPWHKIPWEKVPFIQLETC